MVGLLIRHGHADPVGRWLAGRREGISLSAQGRREADGLRRALQWVPLSAVYSSPLARAIETAAPVARDHCLDIRVRPALTDIDFGEWTGRTIDELAGDPLWRRFNTDRERACPPGGEALCAVQKRVMDELLLLARRHAGETIAIVTHAEPIRCALAAFSGATLNDMMTVEIAPAHVTAVGIEPRVRRVLGINVPADQVVA